MKKKKKAQSLPNEILALPNKDKLYHEAWYKGRNLLNIPHPFRCVALGSPGVGKSTIVKNILLRADPPYQEIYIIHCDPGYTQEYDDVGGILLDKIPAPEDWEGKKKTLVVCDDLELKLMSKDQKRSLDRLYGYCSTHKNISVILCSQDPFNCPPGIRRCANLWILWKAQDLDSLANVARKTGMRANNFHTLFTELICGHHDSLWIDTTINTPAPLRMNGFTIIKKTDGAESKRILEGLDKFTPEN